MVYTYLGRMWDKYTMLILFTIKVIQAFYIVFLFWILMNRSQDAMARRRLKKDVKAVTTTYKGCMCWLSWTCAGFPICNRGHSNISHLISLTCQSGNVTNFLQNFVAGNLYPSFWTFFPQMFDIHGHGINLYFFHC